MDGDIFAILKWGVDFAIFAPLRENLPDSCRQGTIKVDR